MVDEKKDRMAVFWAGPWPDPDDWVKEAFEKYKDQPADWYKRYFETHWSKPEMIMCHFCSGAGGHERGTGPCTFVKCSRCGGTGKIPYQKILGHKADIVIIDDLLKPDKRPNEEARAKLYKWLRNRLDETKPDDPKEEQNIL